MYPRTGALLFAFSQSPPTAAVVVKAPAVAPNITGAENLNTYLPRKIPEKVEIAVTIIPAKKKLNPELCNPSTNPGPALIPRTKWHPMGYGQSLDDGNEGIQRLVP